MKKLSLLLVSGALLSLASCTTETETTSDAEIDSIVNARVEEIRLQMMMQNDSLINALANAKADSIIAAMKGGNTVTTRSTTTRTTTVNKKPSTSTTSTNTTPDKPDNTVPTNTGKNTGQEGVNTGKKGNQSEGVNTGKKNN